TLLAKAFINESKINAIQIPTILQESYEDIRSIFNKTKENRPNIIFFDNIDILARKPDSNVDHERSRLIKAFVEELDNLPRGVLVLATTDDIQSIDNCIRRSGRMDILIELPLPDDDAREEIIKIQANTLGVCIEDVVIKKLVELTHGYSGADLMKLITNAIKRNIERNNCKINECLKLSLNDFVIDREKAEYDVTLPKISFDDVGGMSHIKDIIKRDVITVLKHRKAIKEAGINIKIPKGILFYGPPGTGKTLLAKAIANEIGMHVMVINASTILSKWLGESEHNIKRLFDTARRNSPTMIILDEIDAIGSKRSSSGDGGSDARASILNELLTQIDGVKNSDDILIIGTTNRKDRLDEALIRAGRLEIHIEVPKPTLNDRIEIFRIHTRDIKLADDVDIEELARIMEDSTGADIEFIVKKAKSIWLNELVNTADSLEYALRNAPVYKEHFLKAINEYRK
ncbi:MAG: AAA family ATPase, partial [Candidatus Nitrosothermus koennekii]